MLFTKSSQSLSEPFFHPHLRVLDRANEEELIPLSNLDFQQPDQDRSWKVVSRLVPVKREICIDLFLNRL